MDKYSIFHIDGGCGKSIVGTSVAKSIKEAYPENKLIVITAYPEVFLHNPNVFRVYKFGNIPYFYDNYIKNKDSKIFRMEPYHSGDLLYKKKHLAEIWCDIFNIPCVTTKPEIFLTERELVSVNKELNKQGPILIVQSSGGAENQNHPYSWSRDLPPAFTQEIINEVKGKFSKILHIRRDKQLELKNTIQLSDSFRNLFCYIYLADKFLCMDSFVQHTAAAFNKPATVGWISNSPVVFGHDIHTNIIASGEESFRHRIDSYLESEDWTGGRFYECPYDDFSKIFNKQDFIDSILGVKKDLIFNSNPTIIF